MEWTATHAEECVLGEGPHEETRERKKPSRRARSRSECGRPCFSRTVELGEFTGPVSA